MISSIVIKELCFKAVRSSGAGGQHVNKVSTKMELSFDVQKSFGLTEKEKLRVNKKLAARINKLNILQLQCGDTRSQYRNKDLVIKRFFELLKACLYISKKRKPTKPTKGSKIRRLEGKKKHAEKKANRRKTNF